MAASGEAALEAGLEAEGAASAVPDNITIPRSRTETPLNNAAVVAAFTLIDDFILNIFLSSP
jgi:hypothetical protein